MPLIETMGLACETDAYDPMEKAMLSHCEQQGLTRRTTLFSGELLGEYPFTNELKMMGHIWRHDGSILIAAKGSAERILPLCDLDKATQDEAEQETLRMSRMGLRVIAVGRMHLETEKDIPATLTDCQLEFLGLIGLQDPPRNGVKEDIVLCNRAGIRVVMITGDNGVTAGAIAKTDWNC